MTSSITSTVPDVLRQKCLEVEGSSRAFSSADSTAAASLSYEKGKILMWRGHETKYFWASNSTGKFTIYRYHNGPEHAQIHLEHDFGKAAVINDAIYFPISESCHGVVVAVSNKSFEEHPNFLAYFALRSRNLLKCVYTQHPITCLQLVMDGTVEQDSFLQLAEQFHSGWPHILLVGCRFGYAYLVHLDITEDDTVESESDCGLDLLKQQNRSKPVKSKKTVPLSKIFYEDEMFVFRSDEGTTKCLEKNKVFVSALTYIEKSRLVVVGFNFGGVLIISLKTSKVISLFYIEGSVKCFALQEPEEDPRPILFFWVCINVVQKGPVVILLSINFPKDEAATKDPSEYTFDEPVFIPSLKWYPDNCSQMISIRTLLIDKNKISGNGSEGLDKSDNTNLAVQKSELINYDTSLVLMVWVEIRRGGNFVMHGSLFDLNAYYAKRLVGRVTIDNTLARQMHFFSRFSSSNSFSSTARGLLDVCAHSVYRFSAPAFLKDSIDQLYYPSVFYITVNCLTENKFVQVKVQPIQIQLIANISDNIETYFEEPREACKWVCAIGLANSVPASNSNEEKACLLRVLVHNFFPGILKLVEACSSKSEALKFIQKWCWKEVEMTKSKFDDLCSPLFAVPPLELSPSARGFIHHARVFFKRASLTLECVSAKIAALDDDEWQNSIDVQHKATRQVRLYAYGVAFGMVYNLLPNDPVASALFDQVALNFVQRYEKIQLLRKQMKIHKLVSEAMDSEPNHFVWDRKNAEEWFPPNSYSCFLPVLLMMEVPELSKLAMLGYYCLDLESFAVKDSVQEKLFEKCCSFFMQEEFCLDVMNRIRKIWLDDKQVGLVDLESTELLSRFNDTGKSVDEFELKWLPLSTFDEVEHAKKEYLKLNYGVFKFNLNVIEKRRFNLIIDMPQPCTADEPDFVISCRAQCRELCQRFPWLLKKVDGLPQFVLNKYRENVIKENLEQDNFLRITSRKRPLPQPQIQMSVHHVNGVLPENENKVLANVSRLRQIDDEGKMNDSLQMLEELPLTIATPAKRQRLMLFPPTPVVPSSFGAMPDKPDFISDQFVLSSCSEKKLTANASAKKNVRTKDLDRVNKVIQTPVSLTKGISKIPIRRAGGSSRLLFSGNGDVCDTPTQPDSPIPTPTSILKRAQRRSRLVNHTKPRLRFAAEHKTERIPSRAEKLIEEVNDTSFSTFAVLSSTESSASSLSLLNDSLVEYKKIETKPVVQENKLNRSLNIIIKDQSHDSVNNAQQDRSIEVQDEEDVVEDSQEAGLVLVKSAEVQDEQDVVSDDVGDVLEVPIVKEIYFPSTSQQKPTNAPSDDKEGSEDARDWVNAHLRRSSRMRSPRKFFDENREKH